LLIFNDNHEHQSLLKKNAQRQQLDAYGQLTGFSKKVNQQYTVGGQLKEELSASTKSFI